MPAKASGEIKTRTVHQTQKNGDIYVIQRQTQYDPVKKYNVVISSRIIGKIPKGQKTVVPTRPKRSHGEKVSNSPVPVSLVSATRKKVGMMDIINQIGKTSGIDAAVYGSTDQGTAQKILSLARYLLATNGQSLPGITVWQYTHPLPYEDGMSEDIYHDLFCEVGRDEALMQSFFASRLAGLKDTALLAYDSTTISTYWNQIFEARYGFNKAHDGLETVKLLSLYSIETRQPVAFAKQPGNQSDVITIENALKQLQVLGISKAEIVTDNGYYSEKNIAELLHAHFDFITLIKTNIKWVKKELAWCRIIGRTADRRGFTAAPSWGGMSMDSRAIAGNSQIFRGNHTTFEGWYNSHKIEKCLKLCFEIKRNVFPSHNPFGNYLSYFWLRFGSLLTFAFWFFGFFAVPGSGQEFLTAVEVG